VEKQAADNNAQNEQSEFSTATKRVIDDNAESSSNENKRLKTDQSTNA
jgi:hypothetical protein